MKNDLLESIEERVRQALSKAAELRDTAAEQAEPYLKTAKEKAAAAAEQAEPYLKTAKEKAAAAAEQAEPYLKTAKEKAAAAAEKVAPYLQAARERAEAAAEQAEEALAYTVVPEKEIALSGVDTWRAEFPGTDEAGNQVPFFLEYRVEKGRCLQITAGAEGDAAVRIFPWEEVSLKTDVPYQVGAGSCYLSETRALGHVYARPEGEKEIRAVWDLHILGDERLEGRMDYQGVLYHVSSTAQDTKITVKGVREIEP